MRKLITGLLIVFLTGTAAVQAQYFEGGIKAGLNLSYLSVEDANDNNIIPGFHAGVFGRYMFNEQFAIQPEILYSMKGTKITYDQDFLGIDIADGETNFNLNYIEIPVYFVYYLAEDFNFHLGPYAGFLMNAKVETTNDILNFIEIDSQDDLDKEHFNSLDYGISGGLGFAFGSLDVGFNYTLGLQDVVEEGDPLEVLLGDSKNNTIEVYLGLAF